MGLGAIVTTEAPAPVIIYRKLKANETIAPGDPVSFDASGDIQKALDTHDGPIMYALAGKDASTAMFNDFGGTKYYAVLKKGRVVSKAGGVIKPNKRCFINNASKVIQKTKQTIGSAYSQAEVQAVQNEYWRDAGFYVKKESDDDYAASDAAADDLIVVEVDA